MAAPMQSPRQLLSCVFLLKRSLSNSRSATHCVHGSCDVRFLHQRQNSVFKSRYQPLLSECLKRNFPTVRTCSSSGSDERTSGGAVYGGRSDKLGKADQLISARPANHRSSPISHHRGLKHGDIKIGTESLYDLASDFEQIEDSQKRQQENPDFYRRRIQSEWHAAKTLLAYQDSDTHKCDTRTDSDSQNPRSVDSDPSYYYGVGSLVGCAILGFALFFRKEQKDTIELLIAKSWAADRDGNLAEAEDLLHKALKMAQDKDDQNAVTYIFDQLANLAMMHGNLTNAEGLFKETLRRMISSGTAQDDSAVIEISLKLARMYDRMKRYDDAEQGFQWCISTTEKQLDKVNDKDTRQNLQSLLGMCLDCYARHLAAHGRLQQAKETYKQALAICENELIIDGIPHPQTVILLNDLGTVYDLGGNYSEAIEFIEKAVNLAETRSPHDLPTVLCNLASVKMHADKFEEAKSHYTRALSLAEKQGDAAVIMEIKNNIAQMETNIFLKDQKRHRQGNKK